MKNQIYWLFPFGVVLIAFYGIVPHDWVNWDDPLHVTENPLLVPLSWRHFVSFWITPYESLYIPLSYTLFAAEASVARICGGLPGDAVPPPYIFHAVSVVLHGVNSLLIYKVLSNTTAAKSAAALSAGFFAVHPLQVESVAWISEQRGLLATAFGLSALLLYRTASRNGFGPRYALATTAFGCGLLSKPAVAMLPAIAMAIDLFERAATARTLRATLRLLAPWFLLSLVAMTVTSVLQAEARSSTIPLLARPLVAGHAISFYLWKTIVPYGLCIDYGLNPTVILPRTTTLPIALAAWTAVVVLLGFPRARVFRLPTLLFLVSLAPVLGFVPFLYQNISTVADRYAYLAMLGPAWGICTMLSHWQGIPLRAAMCCILVGLAGLSWQQSTIWRNSMTLNAHAVAINGGTSVALNNLGMAMLDCDRTGEAEQLFHRAIERDPNNTRAYFNLGLAAHRLQRWDIAERAYNAAISREPRYAKAYNNLGILQGQMGRLREAHESFSAAIAANPRLMEAHRNLAQAEALITDSGTTTP